MAEKIVHGAYSLEHRRPKPEALGEYMPLWDELTALMTLRGTPDAPEDLEDRIQEVMAEMTPHTFLIDKATFDNIVTDVGAKDMLDKYFKGSAYTQTMRMGLKGTGTAVVGDTQASHGAWLEQGLANAPTYTGNRPSITFNAATGAGAGSRQSASPATAFAITSTGTVFGLFMNNGGSATKDDTTGILYSAGDYSNGSKAVNNLDTINATYTLNI